MYTCVWDICSHYTYSCSFLSAQTSDFIYVENQRSYQLPCIYYRIRSDHNVDGTSSSVNRWCYMSRSQYKSVDCHGSFTWEYPTKKPYSTSVQRSKKKARLRQQALEAALTAGADYLLVSQAHSQLSSISQS